MTMREINVLLTAVGRRTYLVDYFREALLPCGGKVYAANCLRDATGLMAADGFEIVAKSADEVYQISKTLCKLMNPFGGFLLAPGCDLAPTIPLENLQAMARAASEV